MEGPPAGLGRSLKLHRSELRCTYSQSNAMSLRMHQSVISGRSSRSLLALQRMTWQLVFAGAVAGHLLEPHFDCIMALDTDVPSQKVSLFARA